MFYLKAEVCQVSTASLNGVNLSSQNGGKSKSVAWCYTPVQPLQLYQGDGGREARGIEECTC